MNSPTLEEVQEGVINDLMTGSKGSVTEPGDTIRHEIRGTEGEDR